MGCAVPLIQMSEHFGIAQFNCGSNIPLFVGFAVLLYCGSSTPLFVGSAVPLIQMSNQMLLSPVSKLGVWFNFPLWNCSIKLWVEHSTVCGVGCPIKLWVEQSTVCGVDCPIKFWVEHSTVCGVGCPINSDVKSDDIVAGVKARRMVQLSTLESLY